MENEFTSIPALYSDCHVFCCFCNSNWTYYLHNFTCAWLWSWRAWANYSNICTQTWKYRGFCILWLKCMTWIAWRSAILYFNDLFCQTTDWPTGCSTKANFTRQWHHFAVPRSTLINLNHQPQPVFLKLTHKCIAILKWNESKILPFKKLAGNARQHRAA